MVPLRPPYKYLDNPDNWGLLQQFGIAITSVVIRTLGLLNCSNVQYVDEGFLQNMPNRQRQKSGRLAWIKYKVLKVKVGKELRPIQERRGHGDKPNPLCMVRGHFRDYEANGLFGRLRGSKYSAVWVPAFARGDHNDGVVVRDYALVPNEKGQNPLEKGP